MMKPLLILKTGNTIELFTKQGVDFEDWFCAGLNLERENVVVVDIHEGQELPEIESISAIVITGSPAYITDFAEWNFRAADFIRQAFACCLPVLGVCYGHQLIAWAFGGEVDFHPKGREIGTVQIQLSPAAFTDELLMGLPKTMAVNVSHQQSVIELPAEAVRLAGNDFEPNHGFRLGERTWGIQFHPEFSADTTKAYIEARKSDINGEGLDASQLLETVTDTPESLDILRRFMEIIRRQ